MKGLNLLLPAFFALLACWQSASAQLHENFNRPQLQGGEYPWQITTGTGVTGGFVLKQNQLRSDADGNSGTRTAAISTPVAIAADRYYLRLSLTALLDFTVSSSLKRTNYALFALSRQQPDLLQPFSGLALRLNFDGCQLQELRAGEVTFESPELPLLPRSLANVRLLQTGSHHWALVSQTDTVKFQMHLQADSLLHAGLLVSCSSNAREQSFWFDDLRADIFPFIKNFEVADPQSLRLVFSTSLAVATASRPENYLLNDRATPESVLFNAEEDTVVTLRFAEPFPEDQPLRMLVSGVADPFGNAVPADMPLQLSFSFSAPDLLPPAIASAGGLQDGCLLLQANEPLDTTRLQPDFFSVDGFASTALAVKPDSGGLRICFKEDFEVGKSYTLAVTGWQDAAGNVLYDTLQTTFVFADQVPPDLLGAQALAENRLVLQFSEALHPQQSLQTGLYQLHTGLQPVAASLQENQPGRVLLLFEEAFPANQPLEVTASSVPDVFGNRMPAPQTAGFEFDTRSPTIATSGAVTALDAHTLQIQFSEALDSASVVIPNHYEVDQRHGHPRAVTWQRTQADLVLLHFEQAFTPEQEYFLTAAHARDLAGNQMGNRRRGFVFDRHPPRLLHLWPYSPRELLLDFSEPLLPATVNKATNFTLLPATKPVTASHFLQVPHQILLTFAEPVPLQQNLNLLIQHLADLRGNQLDSMLITRNFHPLEIAELQATAENRLRIRFTRQPADSTIKPENFCVFPASQPELWAHPMQIVADTALPHTFALVFDSHFTAGHAFELQATGLADSAGQAAPVLSAAFTFAPLVSATRVADSQLLELELARHPGGHLGAESFLLQPGYLHPAQVVFLEDARKIQLLFAQPFEPDSLYHLHLQLSPGPGKTLLPAQQLPFRLDTRPPTITGLQVTGRDRLQLRFSEPVALLSAEAFNHYQLLSEGIFWSAVDLQQNSVAVLQTTEALRYDTTYQLRVAGVEDLAGNAIVPDTLHFSLAAPARRHELLITEIMADPSPPAGLPEAEFVEVFNPSGRSLNLADVRLLAGEVAVDLPVFSLEPGEYAILCGTTAAKSFEETVLTVPVPGFPSIPNSGGQLLLRNIFGETVFEIDWSPRWLGKGRQAEGGFSLEMRDISRPCLEAPNWQASQAAAGGTPGRPNSVQEQVFDQLPPRLQRTSVPDSLQLVLHFNEKLDSGSVARANFSIPGGPAVDAALFSFGRPREARLLLATPVAPNRPYVLQWQNLSDCSGNMAGGLQQAVFVLPVAGQPGDLHLSEILFNPPPGGTDFLELYNGSENYLDLRHWAVAGRNSSAPAPLTESSYVLPPGGFVVLTGEPELLKQQYPALPDSLLLQTELPAFPDEEGEARLLAPGDGLAEAFAYHEDQHFALIDDAEAVSLERISYGQPAGEPQNWHSAAAVTGYATPGMPNSQSRQHPAANADCVTVEPAAITPDQDGFNDFAEIVFNCKRQGEVASIFIYSAAGQLVKTLVQNNLLPVSGTYRWDGTTDNGSRARTGYYLVLVEMFDLDGNVRYIKKAVAVGPGY